jgi:fibronectin type 3 domain-containing protein
MRKHLIALLLLCSFAYAHTVTLTWQLSPTQAKWQSIYRQIGCTGAYVKRAQVSNTTVEWVDTTVKNGKTYCYYVTMTDEEKVMSQPSNVVQVEIPNE